MNTRTLQLMLLFDCRRRISEHRCLALLLAAYLLIVGVVIPPTLESPVCDDGVFAATARELAETGVLRISDLPSMSLVTHAAWGAAFIRLIGDNWWSLRVSSMIMAWIGGLALYALCLEFNRARMEAAVACGSYVFCPLVFALSYTFMTDITAASLMLCCLACMPAALRTGTVLRFALLGILGGMACLARQTAAIPIIMLGVVMLGERLIGRRRWRDLFAVGTPVALMVGGYMYWLHAVNGVPSVYGSVSLHPEIALHLKGLVSKVLCLALEAALMSAPLIVCVASRISWRSTMLGRHRWRSALGAVGFALFIGRFAVELKPFRGYELFDAGLGFPPTHDGLYDAFRSPMMMHGVTLFHAGLLVLATLFLLLLMGIAIVSARDIIRGWRGDAVGISQLVAVLSLGGYFGLLLMIEFVFDRYVVPLILLVLVAQIMCSNSGDGPRRCGWTWLTMAIVIGCCLIGTQDILQLRRAYWSTVARLHADGVGIDDLDAGAAYWQTYVHEPALRGRAPTGPTFLAGLPSHPRTMFPASTPGWKLAFEPVDGWSIHEQVRFSSWIRTGEIYILRRPEIGQIQQGDFAGETDAVQSAETSDVGTD